LSEDPEEFNVGDLVTVEVDNWGTWIPGLINFVYGDGIYYIELLDPGEFRPDWPELETFELFGKEFNPLFDFGHWQLTLVERASEEK
jgi:hypothetical protein